MQSNWFHMRDFKLPIEIDLNFRRKSQECHHLLVPMNWIIFNYMSEGLFFGKRTRVPVTAILVIWLPCEVRTPLTYINALNILHKELVSAVTFISINTSSTKVANLQFVIYQWVI